MRLEPFRRIVTGHDNAGIAIVLEDRAPPRTVEVGGSLDVVFYEVWNTRESPARIDRQSSEPEEGGIVLAPPKTGTRIRVVDFAPESAEARSTSVSEAAERFAEFGGAGSVTSSTSGSSHAFMHRTETIDYGIVLKGEITLVLDDSEAVIRAGDIVIQRGTNHAWANRTKEVCRVAFVLVDGAYDRDLGQVFRL